MASNKKAVQKSPEERQRIYDATTVEERLRVVKERTEPGFAATRKPLRVGVAFDRDSAVYRLVEEMSYYLGYPSGAEINEQTNRVIFKKTKEDGMIQWRANESIPAEINDVLKAILTAVLTSEDPSFLSQLRQLTVTSQHGVSDGNSKVNQFFKNLEEYRHATAGVRQEINLANAQAALAALTPEQTQALLATTQVGGVVATNLVPA